MGAIVVCGATKRCPGVVAVEHKAFELEHADIEHVVEAGHDRGGDIGQLVSQVRACLDTVDVRSSTYLAFT